MTHMIMMDSNPDGIYPAYLITDGIMNRISRGRNASMGKTNSVNGTLRESINRIGPVRGRPFLRLSEEKQHHPRYSEPCDAASLSGGLLTYLGP